MMYVSEVTDSWQPHSSHKMGEWYSDIRAPAGTPRFYSVRKCIVCGAEQISHPAGRFADDDLLDECIGD